MSRRALLIVAVLVMTAVIADDRPMVSAEVGGMSPVRVLDTRVGVGLGPGRLMPGVTARLTVPGVTVSGETALLVNLTAVDATGPGHVSAWSCADPRPDTSILNFVPGRAIPNMAALRYTNDGICLSTVTPVHLIADVTAITTDGDYHGTAPQRLVDTRTVHPYEPHHEHRVQIGGTPGIPDTAAAAALNVTVVAGSQPGWIRVAPCGANSDASTANFQAGEVVAHFTFTALAARDACITTSATVDVIVDSFGWMTANSNLKMLTPARLLDTRTGHGGTSGAAGNGQLVRLRVAGRGGVPDNATGATLNIVAVEGAAFGHITAWPCDQPQPVASALNMWPGVLRANQATLKLSVAGDICLRPTISDTTTRIDIVIDVVGYTTSPGTGITSPTPSSPPLTTPAPATNPPGFGRFETLPVGAALPSGAECAARVRPAAEIRPANTTSNQNRGGPQYAIDDSQYNGWFRRVDGNFSGTTDEIIQWAACKWGIDEDIARAQIIKESWWYQSTTGDVASGQPSYGLGQVRQAYHGMAFQHGAVNARNSSAFNLDYTYAVWRGCFEGFYTWLNQTNDRNGTYGPGDAWGCVGVWFSGRWYWNNDAYLNQPGDGVRWFYENRTWQTSTFINS